MFNFENIISKKSTSHWIFAVQEDDSLIKNLVGIDDCDDIVKYVFTGFYKELHDLNDLLHRKQPFNMYK